MTNGDISYHLLKETRLKLGIDIEEVAKSMRIKPRYLLAIEAGDLSEFASYAYAEGYAKKYACHLGVDPDKIVLSKTIKKRYNIIDNTSKLNVNKFAFLCLFCAVAIIILWQSASKEEAAGVIDILYKEHSTL